MAEYFWSNTANKDPILQQATLQRYCTMISFEVLAWYSLIQTCHFIAHPSAAQLIRYSRAQVTRFVGLVEGILIGAAKPLPNGGR
jgi:hypothetical protein